MSWRARFREPKQLSPLQWTRPGGAASAAWILLLDLLTEVDDVLLADVK
jgi:hypothetical protein